MNTADVMRLSLEMAGMDAIPADSGIFRPCGKGERVLLGIDISCCNKMVRIKRFVSFCQGCPGNRHSCTSGN